MKRTIRGIIELEYDDEDQLIDEIYVTFSPSKKLRKNWILLDEWQSQDETPITLEDYILAHAELEKRVEREDEEDRVDSILTQRSRDQLFEKVKKLSYQGLRN